MTIKLIVAVDLNNGIGKDNQLLWHLPEDLKHFKKTTLGQVVVMGRKTYESIGRLLPQRTNIILTRDKEFKLDSNQSYIKAGSIEEVLELNKLLSQDIFIIGGAEIYKQFLLHADSIYITRVESEFAADAFFPELNEEEWEEMSKKKGIKNEKNPYDYYFIHLKRRDE